MPRPDIKSCLLIESPASESDDELRAYVNQLLTTIYGTLPDWLEFKVGRRVRWRDTQFREFICVAGSVSARLMLHAGQAGGISRAVITYGSSLDGKLATREIRAGAETRFEPEELRVA